MSTAWEAGDAGRGVRAGIRAEPEYRDDIRDRPHRIVRRDDADRALARTDRLERSELAVQQLHGEKNARAGP
jgi:hypothetical protein